jgi:capsular polysaccharide biosynthesis protein
MHLLGPFKRRTLADLLADAVANPATARVGGRLIAAPARIALPALPTGRHVFGHGNITQHPPGADWSEDGYESVAAWLCAFHDVLVFGDAGIVVIDDVVVADTLLQTHPETHAYRVVGDAIVLETEGPAVDLPGRCLSLLSFNHANYYHWTIDALGRLGAADETLLAACDRVLAPALEQDFQRQGFARTGLADRFPVHTVGPRTLFQVECLEVPWSLTCDHRPHPLLPAMFRGWADGAPAAGRNWPARIYVDRRGGANRRMVNEDALVDALAGLGFVPVRLEALDLADQIGLFAHAHCIVAPHGAGLANLVFARPGTAVVEIHVDAWVNWCFRRLAAVCGLDYDCALGRVLPGSESVWINRRAWQVSVLHVTGAVQQALVQMAARPALGSAP